MKQVAIALLAAAVLVSISAQKTVHAQGVSPSFIVGGGLGMPIDAEGVDNELAIRGGVSVPVYRNLHAVLEGHYSKYGPKVDPQLISAVSSADGKHLGGNIGVMLRSPSSSVSVYGHGGIGLTRIEASASVSYLGESYLGESLSVSDTSTVLSFTIGGGVQIPINPSISVALDTRYRHAATKFEATKWIPITVSIVFSP